jgi:hypothetical protein
MSLTRVRDIGYDIAMARTRMHQTTVRFAPELWEQLEIEARRSGVSVAHFVREAALARLAYAAGRRAEPNNPFAWADLDPSGRLARLVEQHLEDSAAVHAQAKQARRHAQELRDSAAAVRGVKTAAARLEKTAEAQGDEPAEAQREEG